MEREIPELPVEANVPVPEQDRRKTVMLQAAAAYDQAEYERAEMHRLIEQSKMALEVQKNQIDDLKLALAEERNRHASLQQVYNEKVQDCADLEAILAGAQGNLEDLAARLGRFEFSRLKRRRNGKRGESLSDSGASAVEMAIGEAVLAHRKPLLGQPPDGSE